MNTFQREGDLLLARHPAGPRGEWFPGAIGFGDSMMPFFMPQDEIWLAPIAPSAIRVGDVVTFRTSENTLVTHRVVKIARRNETLVFLTKGDNRLEWDPWLHAHQVVGRVTKVRKWDLTRPWWRWTGWFIACFSHAQGVIYQRLAGSRFNKMRHGLERKGLFPQVRFLPLFRIGSNPPLAIFFMAASRRQGYERS